MEQVMEAIANINGALFVFCLVFITLDVISGFAQAAANKCIQSKKMKDGLWHKSGIMLLIVLGMLVDVAVYFGIGISYSPVYEIICVWVIGMEITSILENIKKINPELENTSRLFKHFGEDD